MKELSIEEKAKAYDDALERARKSHDNAHGLIKKEWVETIFPELKESKDERIRKTLLKLVNDTNGEGFWNYYKVHKEEALAWLEKQGEQKPTDLRTWKYIVADVLTAKNGIGQYLDDPWTTEVAERLQERFGNIKQKSVDVKPHIPDGSTDYDKGYEEAQRYLSERGFDIPWNDGDVFVDEKYITQTVANVLAWGDEHPKQNLEKQGASKTTKGIFEVWKDMRCEIYAQASGNRHEPNCSDNTTKLFSLNDIDELIEKLGEQKPTDKIEPKFKVGDFIVNDYCVGRIVEITNDAYLLDTKQGIPFSCHGTHLWDITKDAKDGDVLTWDDSGCITLFNYIHANGKSFDSHGYVGHCTGIFHAEKTSYHDVIGAHPATKEQRDTLFEKMKEAGYEWSAEKKELRKIEGEPKNHEQYTMSEIADSVIDFRQKPEQSNEENYEIDGLFYAKAILEKTLGKVEGYQSDDGILEHKSAINVVTKLCNKISVTVND